MSDERLIEREAAALVVLAQRGVPPDIQELLVRGNPQIGVAPGALRAALTSQGTVGRGATEEMVEAALRAFYRHTAVQNFPRSAQDMMERALEAALALSSRRETAEEWQPIETAPHSDGWIARSLFATRREWGWEMWVGQCDDGDIWLGRDGAGSCFDTDKPTHWRPLPLAPDDGQKDSA